MNARSGTRLPINEPFYQTTLPEQTLPPRARAIGLSMNAGSGARLPINEPFYQIARPEQTLPPGARAIGLSMNAGSGTRPQVNEPFYQIALPPRLGHEFRLRCDLRCGRRGGWLLAERPGTLAKQFRAICGVILDLPQDIGHRASYAHRLRNNSPSGTAGICKFGHHGFQIAKRTLQGDCMGFGFSSLVLLHVGKLGSNLGNPSFLRSDDASKSGDAVLDLTHFAIGLGGLVLTGHLMSKQKHPALAQGRGISLLGSCMLGAERV